MTIRFRCKCGRNFEVADSAAGRKARCTDCGLTFLVPSPNAQPAAPAADNSPLAQAARAAQAAAAAQASPAAHPAQAQQPAARQAARPHAPAAQPAAGQAARPHAPRTAQRPAVPPTVHRPAAPVPRPAAPDTTYALQGNDDDVPMARLAPVPVHHGPRKPKLTAVQAVMGVSLIAALVVMVDSVATMLGAIQAQAQGMDLAYGGAALFAGIGVIVALAGGAGSRVCIGIMLGGAARNLLNGPALMFLAFTKNEVVTSQGPDAVMVCGVAGVFSLLAGIVYILAMLLSKSVRKYIGGHYGLVIGGGVVGLLLGPAIVSTALPAPELVFARQITALRVQASTSTDPGGASVVLTPKQQTESREAMMEQMKDIHRALSEYIQNRYKLPAHLGLLVGDNCPSKLFISPTRGPTAKALRDQAGDIKDSDVIYMFKEGRSEKQLQSIPVATTAELIVAYSGPRCGLGEGALVMRLPGVQVAAPVEWLDKPALEKQRAATEKWLKDNPPPPKDNMPEKLPGFDE